MGNNLDKLETILNYEEEIIGEFKHLLDKEGKEILETLHLIRYIKLSSITIFENIKNFENFVNSAKHSRRWGGRNPKYSFKAIEQRKMKLLKNLEDISSSMKKLVLKHKHELKLDKYSEKLLKNSKNTLKKIDYKILKN